MIIFILIIIIFSLANRARGCRIFNYVKSTVITRLITMSVMSITTLMIYPQEPIYSPFIYLGLLMLWCSFGWDYFWSAAIGDSAIHSRIWGTIAMTIRQSLIIPFYSYIIFITDAPWWHIFYSCSLFFMGLPYFIFGKIYNDDRRVSYSEYTIGGIIGATTYFIGI